MTAAPLAVAGTLAVMPTAASSSSHGGTSVFFSIILPIITLVLGVVLGTWFTAYMSRPKLKVVGGGGGATSTSLRVMNRPGFMGLSLQETVIFGKRISDGIYKGIPIERAAANECVAHLYDKETGDLASVLYWRTVSVSGAGPPRTVIDLKSGEQADLLVFARKPDDPVKYFVFKPGGESFQAIVPPDSAMLSETRRFFIRIQYSFGRQSLVINVKVRRALEGRLYFESDASGCSF